jgi:hypothetical protein
MDADIKAVESLAKILLNEKPVKHKKTGMTKDETDEMINSMVIDIQKKLIAYKCLRKAVLESNESKSISSKAGRYMDKEITKIGRE